MEVTVAITACVDEQCPIIRVPGADVSVTLSDGTVLTGTTGTNGLVVFDFEQSGDVIVTAASPLLSGRLTHPATVRRDDQQTTVDLIDPQLARLSR